MTQALPTGKLRVALLTREYPPEVYGGAGVHVEYLARELAHLVSVDVHCFGADRPDHGASPRVFAYRSWDRLAGREIASKHGNNTERIEEPF